MITTFEDYSVTEDPEQVYLPSPERIRRLSAVIRRGWSDREYLKRSASRPRRWTVSEVSVCLDLSEYSNE
jgi:hypothetical protein